MCAFEEAVLNISQVYWRRLVGLSLVMVASSPADLGCLIHDGPEHSRLELVRC